MLGLKLIHVSKRGHRSQLIHQQPHNRFSLFALPIWQASNLNQTTFQHCSSVDVCKFNYGVMQTKRSRHYGKARNIAYDQLFFTVVGLQTGMYRSSADFADFPPNWMLCDSWKMDYTSMNIYGLYLYSWNVDIPEFLSRNNGFVNLILKYSVWGKEQWTVNPPNPPALRTGWGKHTH